MKTAFKFFSVSLLGRLSLASVLLAGFAVPLPVPAAELAVVDGPDGGQMITGALPNGTTGTAALRIGLKRLHGQFNTAPKLLRAVRSKDSKVTIAVFKAVWHGNPVDGLAIATYDTEGHAHFAALFDNPQHLSKSLSPMLERFNADTNSDLEKERPAGGTASGPNFAGYEAAATHVKLTRTQFPDGSATIGVAPGFTPGLMNSGQFSASAEDGSYTNLYLPVSLLDPRGSNYQREVQISGGRPPNIPGQIVIEHDSDPVSAWKKLLAGRANQRGDADPSPNIMLSAPMKETVPGFNGRMVAGTMTLHNETYVFSGTLLVSSVSPEGAWLLQITMRAAPESHAAADMPLLIAMNNSIRVDMNVVRNQTMARIDAINAYTSHWLAANKQAGDEERNRVFNNSMHEAAVAQDNINRSSAGFINYINDTTVVAHDPSGAHGTMDANLANALVNSDPQNFHVVPVSQYIPGTDY